MSFPREEAKQAWYDCDTAGKLEARIEALWNAQMEKLRENAAQMRVRMLAALSVEDGEKAVLRKIDIDTALQHFLALLNEPETFRRECSVSLCPLVHPPVLNTREGQRRELQRRNYDDLEVKIVKIANRSTTRRKVTRRK